MRPKFYLLLACSLAAQAAIADAGAALAVPEPAMRRSAPDQSLCARMAAFAAPFEKLELFAPGFSPAARTAVETGPDLRDAATSAQILKRAGEFASRKAKSGRDLVIISGAYVHILPALSGLARKGYLPITRITGSIGRPDHSAKDVADQTLRLSQALYAAFGDASPKKPAQYCASIPAGKLKGYAAVLGEIPPHATSIPGQPDYELLARVLEADKGITRILYIAEDLSAAGFDPSQNPAYPRNAFLLNAEKGGAALEYGAFSASSDGEKSLFRPSSGHRLNRMSEK